MLDGPPPKHLATSCDAGSRKTLPCCSPQGWAAARNPHRRSRHLGRRRSLRACVRGREWSMRHREGMGKTTLWRPPSPAALRSPCARRSARPLAADRRLFLRERKRRGDADLPGAGGVAVGGASGAGLPCSPLHPSCRLRHRPSRWALRRSSPQSRPWPPRRAHDLGPPLLRARARALARRCRP